MTKDNGEENIAASQIDIQNNAEAARKQAKVDLLAHLGTLINQADSSDLEFVCKGGVTVKACRMLLAGRSPVLDRMFTNGMLESSSSVINLPEIPAPALLAMVEFLYTGDIVEYRPKDWQVGLEIVNAAHFFLLPTVDKIVEGFIMAQIPSVGEDLQQAATMLSDVLTFKCLSHDDYAACLQLVSLLELNWAHSDYACHLSEEAVDYILRHTKPNLKTEDRLDVDASLEEDFRFKLKTEDRLDLSLGEYFRFRGVLLWCMYTNHFASIDEVDRLINVAIPIGKENLYCKGVKDLSSGEVIWLPGYDGDRAQDQILQFLHSNGTFESAIGLLAHIDWIRIPPTIFVKIVEPMKLVPESCMLSIFRCHYLHKEISMPLKLSWAHDDAYSVHNGGLVIQKNESSPGSAICQLENRVGEDRCIWRFINHKVNGDYWQLGFVCSEGLSLEDLCRTWDFERDCVDAIRDSRTSALRVVQWHANVGAVYFAGHGSEFSSRDPYYVQSAETIEFRYYRSTGSCSVTVDDTNLGMVWTGLPNTCVFPAVSLDYKSGARVQLEIVSGFEVF